MRVAIIGAGAIGQAVGGLLAAAGHDVVVTWASSEQRLQQAAEAIGHGARAVAPGGAVSDADTVVFAPRFDHVERARDAVGGLAGRVVIDTTNPYTATRDGVVDLGDRTGAQFVVALLPGARYVKGLNTLTAEFLTASAHRTGPDRVVAFLSGDDQGAKLIAADVVRAAGFVPVDLGSLAGSAAQSPGGRYYGEEFHLADVTQLTPL